MPPTSTRVTLVRRPTGEATLDCLALETEPLDQLVDGQVRVAVECVSVDARTRKMLPERGSITRSASATRSWREGSAESASRRSMGGTSAKPCAAGSGSRRS